MASYTHNGDRRAATQPIDNWNAIGDALADVCNELGAAPQGTAATVQARLDAFDTTIAQYGQVAVSNLRIQPGATAANQVRVTCDLIAIEGSIVANIDKTADISVAGINGLDTGSEGANSQYYIWLGFNPTTLVPCALLSLSSTRGGLTLSHGTLAGFTQFRIVGSVKNTSGAFWQAIQQGSIVHSGGTQIVNLNSNGTGTFLNASQQTITVTNVPPHARVVYLEVYFSADLTSGTNLRSLIFRPADVDLATTVARLSDFGPLETSWSAWVRQDVSASQQFTLNVSAPADGVVYVIQVNVVGWEEPRIAV